MNELKTLKKVKVWIPSILSEDGLIEIEVEETEELNEN